MTKQQPKTYAELKTQLDEILQRMEDPDVSIDDAVGLYEAGMSTIKKIEDYLAGAENKITKIKAKFEQQDG